MTDVPDVSPEPQQHMQVQVPVFWVGADELEARVANQFSISRDEEEGDFIFTLGVATAPILSGTQEQIREQASRITYVPIRPLGKYGLSPIRLRQLAGLFKTMVDQLDEYERGRGSGTSA